MYTYRDRIGPRVNCIEDDDSIKIVLVEMRENEKEYFKQLDNSVAEKNYNKKQSRYEYRQALSQSKNFMNEQMNEALRDEFR